MFKNVGNWLGSYLLDSLGYSRRNTTAKPIHIMLAVCDHFEPEWRNADSATQSQRVNRWIQSFPALASSHKDSDGCPPKHTFFYPIEAYDKVHLEKLEAICRQGIGEVEIHLHHDGDTDETLRARLDLAKDQFAKHGFLGRDKHSGALSFGFIHGNWALNNSRPDRRWCGVNDETHVLKHAGCYADFTFPSAPDPTQPRTINRIYYADSSTRRPGGHNCGIDATTGKTPDRGLLLIQGPLTLDWSRRAKGLFPRIENGEITGRNLPIPRRIDLWVRQGICVKGREEWVFVKLHTHGAQEDNMTTLLGKPMDEMFSYLESAYNDGNEYLLHYVSAREMYNIVKAAENGRTGNPHSYRDYVIGSLGVRDSTGFASAQTVQTKV